MLSQRGWKDISVFDGRAAPPLPNDPMWGAGERSYQLGLNGRGQRSLREFGVMPRVSEYAASVNGRLSFDATTGAPVEQRLIPPGEPGAEKPYVTRVLQRDRLQACLLEEVTERYPQVKLEFKTTCDGLDVGGARPAVRLCGASLVGEESDGCDLQTARREFDLIVGADGVRSAIRESLARLPGASTRTVRFPDNNERRYKTLALHPSAVAGTASDLNWGCRNKSLELGMDALPTMEGNMYVCAVLDLPSTAIGLTMDCELIGTRYA